MSDFWTLADKYGLPMAMLFFGMLALFFDIVVSGRRYRAVERQRDQLLRLALGSTRTNERTAKLTERAIDVLAAKHESDDADVAPKYLGG